MPYILVTFIPHVGKYFDTFVGNDVKKSQFPNLRVEFVRGQDPILLLHDETNDVKETLSIDKWDTDTVEEFLKEKLAIL